MVFRNTDEGTPKPATCSAGVRQQHPPGCNGLSTLMLGGGYLYRPAATAAWHAGP
jgi:hypothetical protein